MENFLGARKSLSKWASDQENLANIANHIHRLINNHEHLSLIHIWINTRMDNAFYDELGGSMASDD